MKIDWDSEKQRQVKAPAFPGSASHLQPHLPCPSSTEVMGNEVRGSSSLPPPSPPPLSLLQCGASPWAAAFQGQGWE